MMNGKIDGSLFGDYVKVKANETDQVKESLLKQMFQLIREVSKNERFWIVKTAEDFDGSCLGRPEGFQDDDVTVGWKIHIPQFDPVMDYKERMVKEYHELKTRYNKLHDMCIKYAAGILDFEPSCSLELLKAQKAAMGKYLECLEIRAQIEKLDLHSFRAKVG